MGHVDDIDIRIADLIARCDEGTDPFWAELKEELVKILRARIRIKQSPEKEIRALFLELGAPDHLAGHPYAVQAIILALKDRQLLDNLSRELYPDLAEYFGTSPLRIERSIRHLVEVTWMRGDDTARERYFGNMISADRGKPTNGEFLARLTNVMRERLGDRMVLMH